jgi:hypothetical protein
MWRWRHTNKIQLLSSSALSTPETLPCDCLHLQISRTQFVEQVTALVKRLEGISLPAWAEVVEAVGHGGVDACHSRWAPGQGLSPPPVALECETVYSGRKIATVAHPSSPSTATGRSRSPRSARGWPAHGDSDAPTQRHMFQDWLASIDTTSSSCFAIMKQYEPRKASALVQRHVSIEIWRAKDCRSLQ